MDNVLYLKLASGEEILGKVTENEDGTMTVEKPYAFLQQQDPQTGQIGGGFVPVMMLAHAHTITIVQRPLAIAIPAEAHVDKYLRMIGDRVIQTPKTTIIT